MLPAGAAVARRGRPAQVAELDMAAKAELRAAVERQDAPAQVEKRAQWVEDRGTAERAAPAVPEPQGKVARAVQPAYRKCSGRGSVRVTILPDEERS